MADHTYRVTAAVAVVKVAGELQYIYQGVFLPENVGEKDLQRLLSIGLIEEIKVEEAALPPEIPEVPEVPNLAEFPYPDLQNLARDKGLKVNQSREDLIATLQAL